MWTRELAVTLHGSTDVPIFLQIARAVTDDIRRGRLKPGATVPGSRSLAETLGVHRNTVLAAYRELEAEGWIRTSPARGTFVSAELPDPLPRPFSSSASPRKSVPTEAGFALRPAAAAYLLPEFPRGTLTLGGSVPDVRLVPISALARAYRRALKRHGRSVLDYGNPRGHVKLREQLVQMLSQLRGLAASASSLVVTRGSQMALDLVARALFAPGDVVAVESLGYRPAWDAFARAGARVVPVAVDRAGLDVDALGALAAKKSIRAVYVTPHHQYPTTVVLSAARRLKLLELARAKRFAVIEDDYDHEFHYEGRPVLPLASADSEGVVIYIGTLSKILAPGLRLGFVVAPDAFVDQVAAVRVVADRQGDQAVECAVAELLEDGEIQRHARRMRRIYQSRRDALAEALRSELGEWLSFDLPAGGMALWCSVAKSLDVEAWSARSLEQGVAFFPASRFQIESRSSQQARLGFAALTEAELREAVRRLSRALPSGLRRA